MLEREQPAALVRLDGEQVVDALALQRVGGRGGLDDRFGTPFAAVEAAEHRAAPVALRRRRWRTGEGGAQGDRLGLAEYADRARAHRLGQPGARRERIRRQAPQGALDAREEHEQHEHEGYALGEQGGRGAQVLALAAVRVGERDQSTEREQGPAEDQRGHRQRLVLEEERQLQEQAEQHRRADVACRARLEQLEAEQQDQHGHPGLAAEEVAELQPYPRRDGKREREQQYARRWPATAPQQQCAPRQQGEAERRDPCGKPDRMRGDRHCCGAEQPRALVAAERRRQRGDAFSGQRAAVAEEAEPA